jgi:hypothetical protein
MEKNVGGFDRTGRLVAGPLLIAIGVAIAADIVNVGLAGTIGLAVTALVLVAGAIFLVTGTTQKCPANDLAGVDTYDGD